jgi:hypothetical protein
MTVHDSSTLAARIAAKRVVFNIIARHAGKIDAAAKGRTLQYPAGLVQNVANAKSD